MKILNMITMANFVEPVVISTSAAATTAATQNEQTSATSSNKNSINSSASTEPNVLEVTSISDNSGVISGMYSTNSPLPTFEEAFGSTEICCYSYEGFFSNTTQQNKNHQSTSNEVSINSALIVTTIWVHGRFPLLCQLYIIRTNFKPSTSTRSSTAITAITTVVQNHATAKDHRKR
jgi:hypothetical protein